MSQTPDETTRSTVDPTKSGDQRIPITVVVLTKNEQAGIAATLSHLKDFSKVVVVDSNSDDDTVKIALACGVEVVNFTWDGQYPKKKQWSLENSGSEHPWVLLLDADEYPSRELIEEIRGLIPELNDGVHAAYEINLSYKFAGRFLKHGHRVTKRSLLDVRKSSMPVIDDLNAPGIREVEGHYQAQSRGTIGHLKGLLFHDDVDPVSSWFDRHNRYSDWEAYLRLNDETRREIASKRTSKGSFFDRVPFKPIVFFLYSFIVRGGFRDGRPGLDYALALSMYYWQIGVKTRELKRSSPAPGPTPAKPAR